VLLPITADPFPFFHFYFNETIVTILVVMGGIRLVLSDWHHTRSDWRRARANKNSGKKNVLKRNVIRRDPQKAKQSHQR
jgi:hypothetical protein